MLAGVSSYTNKGKLSPLFPSFCVTNLLKLKNDKFESICELLLSWQLSLFILLRSGTIMFVLLQANKKQVESRPSKKRKKNDCTQIYCKSKNPISRKPISWIRPKSGKTITSWLNAFQSGPNAYCTDHVAEVMLTNCPSCTPTVAHTYTDVRENILTFETAQELL